MFSRIKEPANAPSVVLCGAARRKSCAAKRGLIPMSKLRMENEMRRTKLLMTSAAIALIAAMGVAVAQQQPPSTAPAEKMAPSSSNKQPSATQHQNEGAAPDARSEGSKGHRETTGQASQDRTNRASEQNKAEQDRGNKEQNRATAQAPKEQNKSEDRAKTERTEQNRTTTGQAPREDRTNRASEQNKSEQDRAKIEGNRTTGQGNNVTVNITPEKRTQIHEVIVKERSAPRVASVNFDVSVGTRVPGNVKFAALPASVLAIEPAWRGFEYFLVGERMIIVEPKTLEIVAIIDV